MMNIDIANISKQFNQQPRNLLEAVEQNRLKNQQNQQNEMTLRKQKQSVDFDEQNNPLKLAKAQFDNMSEQDKFVEQQLLQGSIELQPFLDAKDSQSVMQSLQMRRNKLAQNGLRTDEIDNAIQLAQQGDFDTLKQLTGSQIQGAKAIGLLQDNSQNLPAGIQYHQKLEEGRQMMRSSDPQVREQGKNIVNDIRQVLKIEKIGPNMTFTPDGGVENITGATDAIYEQKDAEQRAKIPTAGVIAGIDVNKANQIDRNKNTAELSQKDNLFVQNLQQTMPLAKNAIDNSIKDIDVTLNDLAEVYNNITPTTAGVLGNNLKWSGTEATKVANQLETIVSRFATQEIVDLKNKGISLTPISDADMEIMKKQIANITQSDSPEAMKQATEKAIIYLQDMKDRVQETFQVQYGRVLGQNNEQTQTTQQPQQSNQDFNVDDLVNKYGNM